MSPRLLRLSQFGLVALLIVSQPQPADAGEPTAARTRIAAQRAQANATLAVQERACQAQFLVAPCIDAARKQQRTALTRLRNEELALDEAQRRESASRRRQTLNDKAAAREAKAGTAETATETATEQRTAAASAPPPAAARPDRAAASRPLARKGGAVHRAELEAQSKAQFDARARDAQAHREAVQQRNAQRAASGKSAAPLPVADPPTAPPRPASSP